MYNIHKIQMNTTWIQTVCLIVFSLQCNIFLLQLNSFCLWTLQPILAFLKWFLGFIFLFVLFWLSSRWTIVFVFMVLIMFYVSISWSQGWAEGEVGQNLWCERPKCHLCFQVQNSLWWWKIYWVRFDLWFCRECEEVWTKIQANQGNLQSPFKQNFYDYPLKFSSLHWMTLLKLNFPCVRMDLTLR